VAANCARFSLRTAAGRVGTHWGRADQTARGRLSGAAGSGGRRWRARVTTMCIAGCRPQPAAATFRRSSIPLNISAAALGDGRRGLLAYWAAAPHRH
jgi:hypothetical protein